MRQPNLTNWNYTPGLEGLLFFSQLVEEMVFDHSLDSYRAPALNTNTLCMELLGAVADVRGKNLREGVLDAMLEELGHNLSSDTAAQQLLGGHHPHFVEQLRSRGTALNTLETLANQIWSRISDKYVITLENQLKETIPVANRKEQIESLTRKLVVEWVSRGLSQGFIYHHTRDFFFGAGPKIESLASLETFLLSMRVQASNWEVLFKASKKFGKVPAVATALRVEILEQTPAPRGHGYREKKFLQSLPPDHTFVLSRDISAADGESARKVAELRLANIANVARLQLHRQKLTWEGSAIVYSNEHPENDALELDLPKPAIQKCPDCGLNRVDELSRVTLRAIKAGRSGFVARLNRALRLHTAALDAPAEETQLLGFWSAIEGLLPPPGDQAMINHVVGVLSPVLARCYPEKLLRDLLRSIRKCLGPPGQAVIAKSPIGNTRLQQLAAILAIQDQEPLRDELYVLCNENPLLKRRIFQIKKGLESADEILNLIRGHTRRVEWHIPRIYRSRNLIVHTGRRLPFLEALIENLHSYLDWTLHMIIDTMIRRPSTPSLSGALLEVRMDHLAHIRLLEKDLGKLTDASTVERWVFGDPESRLRSFPMI